MSLNRTLCDVLSEMRKLTEHLTIHVIHQYRATMEFLIEEAQSMGNRMESSLYDKSDYNRIQKKIKEAKEELKELEKELKAKGKKEEEVKSSIHYLLEDY